MRNPISFGILSVIRTLHPSTFNRTLSTAKEAGDNHAECDHYKYRVCDRKDCSAQRNVVEPFPSRTVKRIMATRQNHFFLSDHRLKLGLINGILKDCSGRHVLIWRNQ